MIPWKGYENVSQTVRIQIEKVVEVWKAALGEELVGIYLHGSMALHYFLEETSDIDLLIVTKGRIERELRIELARQVMLIDGDPCPLEMSAVCASELMPWHYPTVCQFHYSDFWTKRYEQLLRGEITEVYIVDHDFEDKDIACHAKLTRQSGVVLYGTPIPEVFAEVPEKDFWDSISDEVEDYDFHAYNPRYFASNLLILGRILSYRRLGRILSKYEGGVWMAENIPPEYRSLVIDALRVWYEGAIVETWDEDGLEELRRYLINEIVK